MKGIQIVHEKERGGSLVASLITSMVVATLLVGLLSATTSHARQKNIDSERNLALVAASNTLEQLRTIPLADLPGLDGAGFDVVGADGEPGGLQPVFGDADGLPGRISVTLDLGYGGARVYRVTTAVDWEGARDRDHIELSTLITARKQ